MLFRMLAFAPMLMVGTATSAQLALDQEYLVPSAGAFTVSASIGRASTSTPGIFRSFEAVQTFTAGKAGILDTLEFQAGSIPRFDPVLGPVPYIGDFVMVLIDGDYLAGSNTILWAGTQSFLSLPTMQNTLQNSIAALTFDVSGAGFRVAPGTRYSVLFSFVVPDDPNFAALLTGSTNRHPTNNPNAPFHRSNYAGGQFARFVDGALTVTPDADVGFRSYVQLTGGVPEPATWGVMTIGFGAIGGAMRARRRRVPVAA